jgi:hypothetical protein
MARQTKVELQVINNVLLSRIANLSGVMNEVINYAGLPSFMQNYIARALKEDRRYVSDLVALKAPGYTP